MPRAQHPEMAESERARRIRRFIRRGEARLLARHPLLKHQDAVGAALFAASVAGMACLGWLYAIGSLSAWLVILGNAFFASILHEVEHDLIHRLYFRTRPVVHHLMMLLVWACRGNVVHGWYRRRIHYHHHRASGSATDVEERLLGLGQPWGLRRMVVMCDGAMAFLLNARMLQKEIAGFRRGQLALA
ncbi:MAG: fatty acid desaturase, partial [Vicinamibacteria bacterium]